MGGFFPWAGRTAADIGDYVTDELSELEWSDLLSPVGIGRRVAQPFLSGAEEYFTGAVTPQTPTAPPAAPQPPPPQQAQQPPAAPERSIQDQLNEILGRNAAQERVATSIENVPSTSWQWGQNVPLAPERADVPLAERPVPRPATDSLLYDAISGRSIPGRESVGGGGFSPSQMDWSKVANPMAFSAFREDEPAIREREARMSLLDQLIRDPFAQQRVVADLDIEKLRSQAEIQNEMARRSETERRDAFDAEMRAAQQDYQTVLSQLERLPPGPQRNAAEAEAQNRYQMIEQRIVQKYGLGARITSSAFYNTAGG